MQSIPQRLKNILPSSGMRALYAKSLSPTPSSITWIRSGTMILSWWTKFQCTLHRWGVYLSPIHLTSNVQEGKFNSAVKTQVEVWVSESNFEHARTMYWGVANFKQWTPQYRGKGQEWLPHQLWFCEKKLQCDINDDFSKEIFQRKNLVRETELLHTMTAP